MNKKRSVKWKALIGVILLCVATWFDWTWIWGVFFLLWAIADLTSGKTFLLEEVSRKFNPFEYWLVLVTLFVLAIYFLMIPFLPQ